MANKLTVPATPAAPDNPYDAMASVFDTLLDPSTPEGNTPPDEPTTPPVELKAETPPVETPPVDPKAETPPVETPPVETSPDEDAEMRKRLDALEAKTNAPPAAETPPP